MDDVQTRDNKERAYHCSDFDFHEWEQHVKENDLIPCAVKDCSEDVLTPAIFPSLRTDEVEAGIWNKFYQPHNSGEVYKPRNYLYAEFEKYFKLCVQVQSICYVCEVGCGFGCSIFPLLQLLPETTQFLASDFSSTSLEILRRNENFVKNSERISVKCYDILQEPSTCSMLSSSSQSSSTETRTSESATAIEPITNACKLQDIVLCIFVLSAVPPQFHVRALLNMAALMKNGAFLLFRDYGIYDMTMFRHKYRMKGADESEYLFRRDKDGTLAYYFSLERLRQLVESTGVLRVEELSYATVEIRNRKKPMQTMKRVFVHMVCSKCDDSRVL